MGFRWYTALVLLIGAPPLASREDIKIRALRVDDFDGLVFAGRRWGNEQPRGPDLPSFFAIEMLPP
jgi:hypothetical protein